jgi:hypothetical protein
MDDRKDLVIPKEFAFVLRLRAAYPALLVAPLIYRVEDDRLLQIVDTSE